MKTIELHTGLIDALCVGMYCTYLDPLELGLDNITSENFSMSKYKAYIIECFNHSLLENGCLNFGHLDIELKPAPKPDIHSPKEYNFETDTLNFLVEYSHSGVIEFASKHRVLFGEFLQEKYSSRDGFLSFTANNYDQWFIDFEDEKVTAIAAFLNWLNHKVIEWVDDIQSEFIEEFNELLHEQDFEEEQTK